MADLLICVDRRDFPAQLINPFFLPESSPVVLCGPTEILRLKRIAVLNSRQSPRINSHSNWVQKTLEALRCFDTRETTLVSSLGITSWDFSTWAGGKLGLPIILVYPAGSAQNFNVSRTKAIVDLGLDERKTLAIRPLKIGLRGKKAESNALRDVWVAALSHMIVPISIRPKGNLAGYLNHPQLGSKTVERQFEIPYEKMQPIKKPRISAYISLPEWYNPVDYLVHWTRSCVGPWPDESRSEYFSRIMESGEDETGGLNTLSRILKEGAIRASGRLVRGKYPVVPFTERPLQDLPLLLRWRAGLRRWTFEPYGIAFKKSRLIELGARPVFYGEIGNYESMSEDDRPFFQLAGSGKQDWRREKEWRIQGDINLKSFSVDEIVAIVHNPNDALQLEKSCPYRIISLHDK